MFNELLQKQNQFYTEHRYRREEKKKKTHKSTVQTADSTSYVRDNQGT